MSDLKMVEVNFSNDRSLKVLKRVQTWSLRIPNMITENRDDHEKLDVRGNEIEDVNLNKNQVFVFSGPGGVSICLL